MDVFDLFAKITVDTSEYVERLNETGAQSKSFASKLGSGLKTAAKVGAAALTAVTGASIALGKSLYANVDKIAEQGDNIDKMSQKMGISAQAYQEWDAILQHSGTSIDSLKPAMKTLAQQAQKGAEEFKKLGISEEEVATLSQEELFAKTIAGLQNMEESTERTALTAKLLGRGAVELGALLNTSAEETEQMRKRVHQLGGVMSNEAVKASAKFKDNLQDLKTAVGGIKMQVTTAFLPAVSDMMDGFTKLINGEEGAEDALNSGMDKFGKAIDEILPKLGDIIEKLLPKVLEAGGKIVSKLAEQLPKIINTIAQQAPTLIHELVQTITKVAPDLIKAGVNLVVQLGVGLLKAIPDLVAAVPDIIIALVDALTDPNNIEQIFSAGFDLIGKLFEGLLSGDFVSKAIEIIGKLASGLINAIGGLLDAGLKAIGKFFEGIFNGDFLGTAGELIGKLGDAIVGVAMGLLGAGAKVIEKIWDGMKSAWVAVDNWISEVIYGTISGAVAQIDGMNKATANAIAGGAILAESSKGKTKTSTSSPTGGNYASSNHYINLYMGSDKVGSAVYNSEQKRAMQNGGYR